MPAFSVYLKTLLTVAALLTSAVVAANLVLNPFAIFPAYEIPGLNARKTEFFKHIRLVKAYRLREVKPEVVLAGNSRVDMAFDPEHPALKRRSYKVYNSALAGASIYEVLRYLQHTHRLAPVKLAVVGLDRSMFQGKAKPDFDEDILATSPEGKANPYPIVNLVRTALSLDTLIASVGTAMRQREEGIREFRADGMRLTRSADRGVQVAGGHRVAFSQALITRDEETVRSATAAQGKEMLGYFRRLLDYCRAERIELVLFIHPLHAWDLENNHLLHQSEEMENWKRELVRIAAEEAGAGRAAFPLWDFSDYNAVTTEPVPAKGDKNAVMRYYWEPHHYKKMTGDLILDRVLDFRSEERALPEDFGVLLSSANVQRSIANARAARLQYKARHPADIAEIERLVAVP
jgi:hypothetical protein